MNPRVGGFEYVLSPCGHFKWTLLKIQQFLPPSQPPLIFTARNFGDLSSWHWNPRLCGLAWVCDHLLQKYPSQFLSTTCECGTTHFAAALTASPPISTTPPLLPIWMNVASLNPWLSSFHPAQFDNSSGCYLF